MEYFHTPQFPQFAPPIFVLYHTTEVILYIIDRLSTLDLVETVILQELIRVNLIYYVFIYVSKPNLRLFKLGQSANLIINSLSPGAYPLLKTQVWGKEYPAPVDLY